MRNFFTKGGCRVYWTFNLFNLTVSLILKLTLLSFIFDHTKGPQIVNDFLFDYLWLQGINERPVRFLIFLFQPKENKIGIFYSLITRFPIVEGEMIWVTSSMF